MSMWHISGDLYSIVLH